MIYYIVYVDTCDIQIRLHICKFLTYGTQAQLFTLNDRFKPNTHWIPIAIPTLDAKLW